MGAVDRAELLRRLDGLAVPQVLEAAPDAVRTTWAPALPVELVDWAAVAGTLASAHERGITHGALGADSLRVGNIVAGWSGSGAPADDVAALGHLLPDPVLRARATLADPRARPTMRALADALAASSTGEPRRALRHLGLLAAGAASLMLVLVLIPPAGPPARTLSGPIPRVGGSGWTAGARGDLAVGADWDCDGTPAPVLLERSTGRVWGYPDWQPGTRPVLLDVRTEPATLEEAATCSARLGPDR